MELVHLAKCADCGTEATMRCVGQRSSYVTLELKVDLFDLFDALYQFREWRPLREVIHLVYTNIQLPTLEDLASCLETRRSHDAYAIYQLFQLIKSMN
ncbi:hypothetical protein HZ326_28983 [Fusarium oxysporum f. sp. albedinis]|nr:hypothetical protein HZ326_28983 [Fusarium oxysporum f. sp. albedinis]